MPHASGAPVYPMDDPPWILPMTWSVTCIFQAKSPNRLFETLMHNQQISPVYLVDICCLYSINPIPRI